MNRFSFLIRFQIFHSYFKPLFPVLAAAVCMALPFGQQTARQGEENDDCAVLCPHIYSPICGYDGENHKVFTSSCVMERIGCLERKGP